MKEKGKYLCFFSVDNHLEICHKNFEGKTMAEKINLFNQLRKSETCVFHESELESFANSYNLEYLDGGWFCVILVVE